MERDFIDAIKSNFDEYYEYFRVTPESPYRRKLAFVKKLKDDTGYGLRECKEYADTLFLMHDESFKSKFSIQSQRRDKLNNLKNKLLREELTKIISVKSKEELNLAFSKLNNDIIEDILFVFLNEEE